MGDAVSTGEISFPLRYLVKTHSLPKRYIVSRGQDLSNCAARRVSVPWNGLNKG